MGLYILSWNGNIVPAALLPSLQQEVASACAYLAKGTPGSETTLPPTYLQVMSFSGPVSDPEKVEWRVTLLSRETSVGGICGASFRMATTFQGKPVQMSFLVPHQYLPKKNEEIWN